MAKKKLKLRVCPEYICTFALCPDKGTPFPAKAHQELSSNEGIWWPTCLACVLGSLEDFEYVMEPARV